MTPERAFAIKLKAREEDAKLQRAVTRMRDLFVKSLAPGIHHRWNGPNYCRIVWQDSVSGYTEKLVDFHRSLTQFYVDRLLVEMGRLRAEAKRKAVAA